MKKLIYIMVCAFMAVSCSSDDSSGSNNDDDGGNNSCELKELSAGESQNFTNACAIAISSSGMVAVSAYNGFDVDYGALAVVKVAMSYADYKDGDFVAEFQATAPEALAFDEDDNLYIAETEWVAGISVYEKEADNSYTYHKTIQDGFNNPRGLAFDDNGRLFLADDGTGRIIRFDDPLNNNTHVTIGNWDAGIKGLAIKGNTMYVANFNTGVVSKNILKADGTLDELVGGVDVSHATDVSVRGNKIIITSYAESTISIFSDCDFSNENSNSYNNLGKIFGTAFINDNKILAASHDANETVMINLE